MKKRIFVAVDISPAARREIAAYTGKLKSAFSGLRVGWERAEKLHLTLKFLGDTDEEQLEKLKVIVREIAEEVSILKLQISGTGVFPSPRNARVLWLGVRGEVEKLHEINSFLKTECEKIGFKNEPRRYSPHMTVARIREPRKSGELIKTHLESSFETDVFSVSEIVIYESLLQPNGSFYNETFSAQMRK